jgi:hypothetical protein
MDGGGGYISNTIVLSKTKRGESKGRKQNKQGLGTQNRKTAKIVKETV